MRPDAEAAGRGAMDNNLSRYNDPAVVRHYETLGALFPVETALVARHVSAGSSLLDLGVGGGRTTPELSRHAGRYVGSDYSAAMVAACRKRFPELAFVEADATNMPQFADASFDAVMFSFNGIDCIPTDAGRASCLSEVARILRPGGTFIVSSHNARMLVNRPVFEGARPHQALWRLVRALPASIGIARRNLRGGAYRRGEGYIVDPVHGGLDMYVSTPETFGPQLVRAGLEVLEVLGGLHPRENPDMMQPWFYYACRKPAS